MGQNTNLRAVLSFKSEYYLIFYTAGVALLISKSAPA